MCQPVLVMVNGPQRHTPCQLLNVIPVNEVGIRQSVALCVARLNAVQDALNRGTIINFAPRSRRREIEDDGPYFSRFAVADDLRCIILFVLRRVMAQPPYDHDEYKHYQ